MLLPARSRALHPSASLPRGKADPAFRTKPKIALELVEAAVQRRMAFRAVVADILYGEHRGFRKALEKRAVPYWRSSPHACCTPSSGRAPWRRSHWHSPGAKPRSREYERGFNAPSAAGASKAGGPQKQNAVPKVRRSGSSWWSPPPVRRACPTLPPGT